MDFHLLTSLHTLRYQQTILTACQHPIEFRDTCGSIALRGIWQDVVVAWLNRGAGAKPESFTDGLRGFNGFATRIYVHSEDVVHHLNLPLKA